MTKTLRRAPVQKAQKKSFPRLALIIVVCLIGPSNMGGCHSRSGGNNSSSGPTVTLSVDFISIGEGSGITKFTASLSEVPTSDVTVTIGYSGSAIKDVDYFVQGTNGPKTFIFPATSQLINESKQINGGGDLALEGAETIIITILNVQNGIGSGTQSGGQVNVTLYDEQSMAGFVISSISGNTREDGTQATFTVQTTTMPGATVTVNMESLNLTEGSVSPESLNFSGPTAVDPQTITVTGIDDIFGDGDIEYWVQLTATSTDGNYNGLYIPQVKLVNEDDD